MKYTITVAAPDMRRILYGLDSAALRVDAREQGKFEQLRDRIQADVQLPPPKPKRIKAPRPVKPKTVTILLAQSTDKRLVLSDGVVLNAIAHEGCDGCYWLDVNAVSRVKGCQRPTGNVSPKDAIYACGMHTRTDGTASIWVKQP